MAMDMANGSSDANFPAAGGRSEGAGNRTTEADGLFEFEDADAAVAVEMTRSRNRGDEKKTQIKHT